MVHSSQLKGLKSQERRMGFILHRSFCFRQRPDHCSVAEMLCYVIFSFFPVLWLTIQFRPQLIHAHFAVPSGVLAFALGMIFRVPYVITAHSGDVPGAIPKQTDHLFQFLNPFIRPIWRNAAKVTAVSDFVAQLVHKAYGITAQVINNGIDIPLGLAYSKQKNPTPKLLFVGRFNEEKQPLLLLEILSQINNMDWIIHLAGNGLLFDACREKTICLGLESRCFFHGWISNIEVDELMNECDILIMPSLLEGFPVTCLKALRFGLALVTSDHASFRGIVLPGENGYLCKINDPTSYSSALVSLISKPSELTTMQTRSLELAPLYDLKYITSRYEEVFYNVTNFSDFAC